MYYITHTHTHLHTHTHNNNNNTMQALHRMREEVTRESPAKQINVEYMQLDLGSFESTKKFVSDFKGKGLRLHILINNAGIMAVPFGK